MSRRARKRTSFLALALFFVVAIVSYNLFLKSAPRASAAIAFDKNLGSAVNDSCTSSISFTTTNSAAANSKIIVTAGAYGNTSTLTFTVSGGSLTWHTDRSTNASSNNGDEIAIASADAPSGLASSTVITASFSPASSGFCYIGGSSFTGLATGTTYDGTNQGPQGPSDNPSWSGGAISTANANDLIFGFGIFDDEISWAPSYVCTPNSGYTNIHCTWGFNSADTLSNDNYQIVSTTGSYTPGGFFLSAQGSNSIGISVAYKASGGSNSPPTTPTLGVPLSGATNISITPQFQVTSTDPDSDYIEYRVYLYQSNCSTIVGSSPFAETSSQTGWSGQNAGPGGNTAYSSGTAATYTYQGSLSYSTTYCWKADAIDPGGSNSYSSASATRLFTTQVSPGGVQINGGTNITGGSTIQ